MSTGLSQRLREGTSALHSAAEHAGVMPVMLRGALPARGFWQLQRNLLLVYETLEAGLARHATHPVLALLQLGPLARCAALQADLAAGAGPDWSTVLPPAGAAATAYADRLQALPRYAAGDGGACSARLPRLFPPACAGLLCAPVCRAAAHRGAAARLCPIPRPVCPRGVCACMLRGPTRRQQALKTFPL
jgi:hypothetical protein